MKEHGGVSVRANIAEKKCLQNFGRENLGHGTTSQTQTWMGDNIEDIKTEQVGREWAGIKISADMSGDKC